MKAIAGNKSLPAQAWPIAIKLLPHSILLSLNYVCHLAEQKYVWDSTKQPTKALLTIQNVYKAYYYYTFDSI